MSDQRDYFKNYPQEENTENTPNNSDNNGEKSYEDNQSYGAQFEDNYLAGKNSGDYTEPEDNVADYKIKNEPWVNEGFCEPNGEEQSPQYTNPENGGYKMPPKSKKKGKVLKSLAYTVLGVVAVAVVAFSAIGVYTTFFEDKNTETAGITQQQPSKEVVQKTVNKNTELSVADINAKVGPAVVGITGQTAQGEGAGTGIIMKADGYILTNAHVVSGFDNLKVTLQDGTEYAATLVGADIQTDLAVIKIDASNLTVAEFGTSKDLVVGEAVVAIGNPLGLDFAGSVTDGIISALDRKVDMGTAVMHYIQTDAAINSGNSGGPLVNGKGLVIGINSAKISGEVAEGMGFAIPIDTAVPIVNELIANGYVSGRPMIGIGGEDVGTDVAAYNRVPTGVYITYIDEKSPAAKSSLKIGDIITKINGVEIAGVSELNAEKNKHKPGDTVELNYYRMESGEAGTVKIVLDENKGE
ncbi:MAG: trypsin-like peptidase domain-containing protein [Clostridiales bacterium]